MRAALTIALVLAAACDRRPDRAPAEPPATAAPAGDAAPIPADAAAAAITAPGDVLVLTPVAPAIGASWVVTFDADIAFELNFGGHAQTTRTTQAKAKQVTALAVDGLIATRERVTYTKRDTRMLIDGDPRADKPLIRGKTFVVEWKAGAIDVRTAAGGAPPDAVRDEVVKEEDPFRTFEQLGRVIAGAHLVRGRATELPENLFPTKGDQFVPERVLVTYAGMEGDLARVDFDITMTNDEGGLKLKLDLTGAAHFDATGWCRRVELRADVHAELGGTAVGGGTGTATITATDRR